MKATGVVRRIDDLGRIVIPKEIRKNYKINEGDSLEIFVDNNGVILRKYSLTDDILQIAKDIVESFYQVYQKNILVTNKEKVITASLNFHQYVDQDLNSYIKDRIEDRLELMANHQSIILSSEEAVNFFFVPILVNSEAIGSIILLDNNILENDKNIIRFIRLILTKNLE